MKSPGAGIEPIGLIRDLLFRGQTSLPQADDGFWQTFVSLCFRERVEGVVYYLLKKRGTETGIPSIHRQSLERGFQRNLIANLSLRGHLREVLAKLTDAGVDHLLLKGFALAEYLYPSLGMRGMSDVDLLVRKAVLTEVDVCLNALGYRAVDTNVAEASKNPEGYLSSLEYHRTSGLPPIMHVHWHPVNTSVPADAFSPYFNVDRLCEKSSIVRLDNVDTRILSPEHLLIYLCEHALRVNHSFDRLILICDILQVLTVRRDQLVWAKIIDESRIFHITDLVYFGLSVVTLYTGPTIPQEALNCLRPQKRGWEHRLFWFLQTRGLRIRGSSYLLYLALHKDVLGKIRFMMRTVFPPQTIQRQRQRAHENDRSSLFDRIRFLEMGKYLLFVLLRLLRRN